MRLKIDTIRQHLNNRKGSYIVEAAISVPIFIIAIVVMNSIILMYVCIEDANFILTSELRRASVESVYLDTSLLLPHRASEKIRENNSIAKEVHIDELIYRGDYDGIDEVIAVRMQLHMRTANPLNLAAEADYELSGISRAYVGKIRDESPMSISEMSGADAEGVFIFTNRGEKYHNEACNVLTAASQPAVLSAELKKRYRACPKCRSRSAEAGAIVYVFPDEGEAYHLRGCKTLERNYIEVERRVAIDRGYLPCLKCGG